VWGIVDEFGWVISETGDSASARFWPYRNLALESVSTERKSPQHVDVDAVSLEVFMDKLLREMMDEDVMLDVMPGITGSGCSISPHRLHDILTGMIDAGEYRMDG
ncbi:MAG: DUF2750 domain-containing protein, partial [Ketobacteraceae bacterium]|nr:DUF2750 domain-containing protein [Ketobacteraceae bacterium]